MTAKPISLRDRLAPYVMQPQHPLIALRDEARRISQDAQSFAENIDGWLGAHFAATEEKHRYSGDEAA